MTEQPAPCFGGLLRQLRVAAQLSQEELAEAARLSPRTVSDLERGINLTARKETARLLADSLKLSGPGRDLFVRAALNRASSSELRAFMSDWQSGNAELPVPGEPAHSDCGPAARLPVPHELPADVAAFTGRAAELAELDWLLPTTGLRAAEAPGPVVISAVSGTAGVGKTALAVRWGHRAAAAFPDGQLYVNLRGYDPDQPVPPGEALAGFLRALGVAGQDIPQEEAERAARYRSALAGRRILVVLDNAAKEEQVRPLLPGTATAMVLVTSRDSLAGLVARDGARRLDLDLLPAADAVALLNSLIGIRAEADVLAVKSLAEQCARLPLALRVAAEMAAANPDMPLAELAAELADNGNRLELLEAGGDPRGAVAIVFSWSYEHLGPEEAGLFRLLGLHPAAEWDRYAAAALIGNSVAKADRLLARLAKAHLIQATGSGRFVMHDLLRAYAHGLTADQDSETRRATLTRLFDYYLVAAAAAMEAFAPAENHHRPGPPPAALGVPAFGDAASARAWLDAELAALTAVVIYAAGHGWPGHAILLATTIHRYLYSDHDIEGIAICGHALTAARECGDRISEAHALTSLGYFCYRQGRYEQAAELHEHALALGQVIGDRLAQARALGNIAILLDRQGRYQQAADNHLEALNLVRELGDQVAEATALTNLGTVYTRQGRYQEAEALLERAGALLGAIGHRPMSALLISLGEVRYRQSRYPEATDDLRQAFVAAREVGDRMDQAEALAMLGQVSSRCGQYADAAECHQQALTLFRQLGHHDGEADALNGTGEMLLATGQPERACTCHLTALSVTRGGHLRQQARALAGLAAARRALGDLAEARDYDQQALAMYEQIGDPGGLAEALNGAGETLLAVGEAAHARARHNAALALGRGSGDRYQQARAHHGLADVSNSLGQISQAQRHEQHAEDILTDIGIRAAVNVRLGLASAEHSAR